MGRNDVWIAASAAVTGATLMTTDRDFDLLDGTHIQRVWIDPKTRRTP
jgi:tRNA(fMet)-specific endonuclease VapC